jgi:hypothetical protein
VLTHLIYVFINRLLVSIKYLYETYFEAGKMGYVKWLVDELCVFLSLFNSAVSVKTV